MQYNPTSRQTCCNHKSLFLLPHLRDGSVFLFWDPPTWWFVSLSDRQKRVHSKEDKPRSPCRVFGIRTWAAIGEGLQGALKQVVCLGVPLTAHPLPKNRGVASKTFLFLIPVSNQWAFPAISSKPPNRWCLLCPFPPTQMPIQSPLGFPFNPPNWVASEAFLFSSARAGGAASIASRLGIQGGRPLAHPGLDPGAGAGPARPAGEMVGMAMGGRWRRPTEDKIRAAGEGEFDGNVLLIG